MINPHEIQQKEFSKAVRGYREEEVDTFLDMLTVDFEKLIYENQKLNDEIERLNLEIKDLKGDEGSIAKIMEQAGILVEEIKESAEKRGEMILKNAESGAESIIREAKKEALRLSEENRTLRERYRYFKDRYKRLLEDELARFTLTTNDLFPEPEENKLENILNDDDMNSIREKKVTATELMAEEIKRHMDDDRKTMVINSEDLPKL